MNRREIRAATKAEKCRYRFKCPECGAIFVSIWCEQSCYVREDWDGEDVVDGEIEDYGDHGDISQIKCNECGAEEIRWVEIPKWEIGDY